MLITVAARGNAAPVFEKYRGGVIVNSASIAGYTGAHGGGTACVASWRDLIGLTKNGSCTCGGKNIRCHAVAPGKTVTNLRANSEKLIGAKTARDRKIGHWKAVEATVTAGYVISSRAGSADEIVKAVRFLASGMVSCVNDSGL